MPKAETHISKALAHLEKAKEEMRDEREKPRNKLIETQAWLQDAINDVGESKRQLSGIKHHLKRGREVARDDE